MAVLWIYTNFADVKKNRNNIYERKIPVDNTDKTACKHHTA